MGIEAAPRTSDEADGLEESGTSRTADRPETPFGWLAATWVGLGLGIAWPLAMAASAGALRQGGMPLDVGMVLQLAIVAYAAIRLARIAVRAEPRWFSLFFWTYCYVWLGLAGLAQNASAQYPLLTRQHPHTITTANLVVLSGMVFYDLAGAAASRHGGDTIQVRLVSSGRVRLLAVMAIVTAPYFFILRGGFNSLFSSREAVQDALITNGILTEAKAGEAIVSAASTVPAFIAVLTVIRLRTGRGASLPHIILATSLLAVNVVMTNPMNSARYWFLTVAFGFVLTARSWQSPTAVRMTIVGIILASTLLFPYLDYYRYETIRSTRRVGVLYQMTHKTDFDSVGQIQNAVSYSESLGHTNGRQFLGAVLSWVPRNHWRTKPYDTGIVLGEYIGFPNVNLSSPLWAELYLDFSWPGIFVIFSLLGFFSRRLENQYVAVLAGNAKQSQLKLIEIALPVLAVYQVFWLRGALLQATGKLFSIVAVLWFIAGRRSGVGRDRP